MLEKSHELIEGSMPFARMLARRFYHERQANGLDPDDFEAAAYLGLVDAASRFDPSVSNNFRTFAYLRIRGAMADLLRQSGQITRRQIRDTGGNLSPERNGIALNLHALAALSDVLLEAGFKLRKNRDGIVSGLSYERDSDPETRCAVRAVVRLVREMVAELTEKEQQIIRLRYGEGLTFEEMREQLDGSTRSWLSRVHTRALERLREKLQEREERCFELLGAAGCA